MSPLSIDPSFFPPSKSFAAQDQNSQVFVRVLESRDHVACFVEQYGRTAYGPQLQLDLRLSSIY